jgi:MYND finger
MRSLCTLPLHLAHMRVNSHVLSKIMFSNYHRPPINLHFNNTDVILATMSCTSCNKPAQLACSECKESPVLAGDDPRVRYCNTTCQKEDWPNHKPTCLRLKDRQTLYRVSSTAQRLFYMYREATWYNCEIIRVDKDGRDLAQWRMCHPESATVEEALNLHGIVSPSN